MILKIKQILELKSTKALIFKIIEHIWDGRLKKKKKAWNYLVWEIEKNEKKKKRRLSIEGHHQISQYFHKHSIRGKDREKNGIKTI